MAGLSGGDWWGSTYGAPAPTVRAPVKATGAPGVAPYQVTPGFHQAYMPNGTSYMQPDVTPEGPQVENPVVQQSRAMASLQQLGQGFGSASVPPVNYTAPAPPPPAPQASAADSSAATRAAITAGKQAAGERLTGNLKDFGGVMNQRGLVGSGMMAKGFSDLIAQNNAEQERTRAGLLADDLSRQQHVADENLQSQEGWAGRQTQFNLDAAQEANRFATGQQQVAINARNQAMDQLTRLLMASGY